MYCCQRKSEIPHLQTKLIEDEGSRLSCNGYHRRYLHENGPLKILTELRDLIMLKLGKYPDKK